MISGNPFGGVTLRENQTNYNRVFGNYFGVAADGNTLMGNNSNNVQIIRANYNRIGGLSAGQWPMSYPAVVGLGI